MFEQISFSHPNATTLVIRGRFLLSSHAECIKRSCDNSTNAISRWKSRCLQNPVAINILDVGIHESKYDGRVDDQRQ